MNHRTIKFDDTIWTSEWTGQTLMLAAVILVVTVGLASLPTATAQSPDATVTVGNASIQTEETTTVPVVLSEAPDGLAGFDVTVDLTDSSPATIGNASVSDQFGLTNVTVTDDKVTLVGSDTEDNVQGNATDVQLGSVSVSGTENGTTSLSPTATQLDADGGDRLLVTTVPGTVTVGNGNDTQPPNPTVAVEDASVATGEQTSVPVVLSEAPDGVAGFNVTVNVADRSVATLVNASVTDQFGLTNVTVADERITLVGSDTEDNVQSDATDVQLGTVTVNGTAVGETTLSPTVNQLDADGGDRLDAATAGATLIVEDGDDDESNVTATRRIDATTVPAGGSTEVTVTTDIPDSVVNVGVTENFEPAFESAAIVDDDGATISSVTNATDQLTASWGERTEVTLVYNVTVPENADAGETFTISGTAEDTDTGTETTIKGDASIEVGNPDPVAEYANDEDIVEADGLLEAAADFRAGKIEADLLLDVAAAFRSGDPVG